MIPATGQKAKKESEKKKTEQTTMFFDLSFYLM